MAHPILIDAVLPDFGEPTVQPVIPPAIYHARMTAALAAATQAGHDALVVSGAVRNVEKRAVASPLLAIKILDKAGHQIAVHMTDPGTAPIAPGQVHNFVVSLVDPPAAANDVEVAFGAPRKLPAGAHLAPKPAESAHPGAAHEANPGLRGAAEAGPAETPSKPTPLMDLPVEAKPVAATSPYAIHAVHG